VQTAFNSFQYFLLVGIGGVLGWSVIKIVGMSELSSKDVSGLIGTQSAEERAKNLKLMKTQVRSIINSTFGFVGACVLTIYIAAQYPVFDIDETDCIVVYSIVRGLTVLQIPALLFGFLVYYKLNLVVKTKGSSSRDVTQKSPGVSRRGPVGDELPTLDKSGTIPVVKESSSDDKKFMAGANESFPPKGKSPITTTYTTKVDIPSVNFDLEEERKRKEERKIRKRERREAKRLRKLLLQTKEETSHVGYIFVDEFGNDINKRENEMITDKVTNNGDLVEERNARKEKKSKRKEKREKKRKEKEKQKGKGCRIE